MRYLGIDWGFKSIGLAISEGQIASPVSSLSVSGLSDAVSQVVKFIKKEEIDVVILGKPEGEMGKAVESAKKALEEKDIKVTLADETLSTQEAKQTMIEMGLGRKARQDDNAVSAAIILQRFLDEKEGF